jgi:hypothetical protein
VDWAKAAKAETIAALRDALAVAAHAPIPAD